MSHNSQNNKVTRDQKLLVNFVLVNLLYIKFKYSGNILEYFSYLTKKFCIGI